MGKAEGYSEGFSEAPQSLEEEEDDEDDDVGRPINLKDKKNLNYDSDEERQGGHNELLSLDRDRSSTAAEKIPKLQKPQ